MDVPLCVVEIPLAQRNANRHYMISDGTVPLVPRMRVAIAFLVKHMLARGGRNCQTGQNQRSCGCSGQEMHREKCPSVDGPGVPEELWKEDRPKVGLIPPPTNCQQRGEKVWLFILR